MMLVLSLSSFSIQQTPDVIPCIPDEVKGVLNEVWNGGLTSVKELVSDTRFPEDPSMARILQTFDVPRNIGNRYGQRLRAYMVAPENGSYQFKVECNWKCEVYLSNGYHPADKKMILQTQTYLVKTSPAIQMTRNKPYYLEALHAEFVGKDFFELKVKLPDTNIFTFIPSDYLIAYTQGNQSTSGNFLLPGNWAFWSPCSASCGIGHMTRHRSCAARPPGIFIFSRKNGTIAALNESTTCAHRVSCTGIMYLLTQSWQSCDQVCTANQHTCTRTGHDFPPSSALPIYKALNLTCMVKSGPDSKYKYPDHPAFYSVNSSSVGECIGYENIPNEINCAQHANPGAIRICPCRPRTKFLGPPKNISAYNTSSTSIAVTWSSIPQVVITGYRVILNDPKTLNSHYIDCNASTTFVRVDGLGKYRMYCVRVRVLVLRNNEVGNYSDCLNITTGEDVPDKPPYNLRASANTSHSVFASWNPVPFEHRHGVIIGYKVVYFSLNASSAVRVYHNWTVPSTERDTQLSGLEPETLYCVRILAFTRIGDGNVSECEKVKTRKPVMVGSFSLSTKRFLSPSFIKVWWKPQVDVLKDLVSFKVITRSITRENEEHLNKTTSVLLLDKYASEHTVNGLQPFTKMTIQVVAMGTTGPLKYSNAVISETCRCSTQFLSSWWVKPPYAFNTTETSPVPEGLISRMLSKIVMSVCGTCGNNTSTTIVYKSFKPVEAFRDNITTKPFVDLSNFGEFFFPVHESVYMDKSSYYVPFIKVPGIVLVTQRKSPATYARTLARSVFQCWPLVVINIVMAFLAGTVTWLLESSKNRRHFPVPFTKGIQEAFWWSFVTMTTVGYGDRVPKSMSARLFAVIWSLMGIILSSLLTSALTSSLIITVVTEDLQAENGKKIATVADSMEYNFLQQMTGKSGNALNFPSLDQLFKALERGQIEAALIDIHTAFFYKNLFFKSKFKISKIFHHEFTHGVLIGGEASRLKIMFRQQIDMTHTNIMDYLTEMRKTEDREFKGNLPVFAEKATIDFLDPLTELYYLVLMLMVSFLASGMTGGILYHVIRWKIKSRVKPGNFTLTRYNSTNEEMRTILQQFYLEMRNTCKDLRLRHRRELITYINEKHTRLAAAIHQ